MIKEWEPLKIYLTGKQILIPLSAIRIKIKMLGLIGVT